MKSMQIQMARQAGFSLMEILIVVALIAVIGAFAASQIFQGQDRANVKLAQAQLNSLSAKVDQFEMDTGELPSALDDLISDSGFEGWLGPYIKESDMKDPWNTPIEFRKPGENGPYELVSLGADRKSGGESVDKDIRKP